MSCYTCNECGNFFDADFAGCEEDPRCGTELICLGCFERLYDEDGNPYDLDMLPKG